MKLGSDMYHLKTFHIPKHEGVNKLMGLECNQKTTRNPLEIKKILILAYDLKPTEIMLKCRGFFIAIHKHLTQALA